MKQKDFAVSAEMPCFMGVNFYPLAEGHRTEMPVLNLCSYPDQEVVSLTVLPSSYCSRTSGCCEKSYPYSAQIGHIRKKSVAETAALWVLPVLPQRTGGVEGKTKTINSQSKFKLTVVSFLIAIIYLKNNDFTVHSFFSAVVFGKGIP